MSFMTTLALMLGIVAVIAALLAATRRSQPSPPQSGPAGEPNEAKLARLWAGLERIEDRIETLESTLADRVGSTRPRRDS
jgi:hypothetical protein